VSTPSRKPESILVGGKRVELLPPRKPGRQRIAVVRLDNAKHGGGPATVIEISYLPLLELLAKYTDRDGARDSSLRFWGADNKSVVVGGKVSLS
jgi:hypothetical protein